DPCRRPVLHLGPARHFRGAELVPAFPPRRCGIGAVQLLRPPGAGKTRSVARGPGESLGSAKFFGARPRQTPPLRPNRLGPRRRATHEFFFFARRANLFVDAPTKPGQGEFKKSWPSPLLPPGAPSCRVCRSASSAGWRGTR